MKLDASKTSLAIVVFVALGLFSLNPAFAVSDCYVGDAGVWSGDFSTDKYALEDLSRYTSVTGSLSIHRSAADSLEGLECLTKVGGNLRIEENEYLTDLKGLGNLTFIGGRLYIGDNSVLCKSAAEAFKGQVLNAGTIREDIFIYSNKDC